jgi:hypothetical protein
VHDRESIDCRTDYKPFQSSPFPKEGRYDRLKEAQLPTLTPTQQPLRSSIAEAYGIGIRCQRARTIFLISAFSHGNMFLFQFPSSFLLPR